MSSTPVRHLTAAAAAFLLMSCSDSSPTEPQTSPPLPGRWTLTAQVISAEGTLCFPLPDMGSVARTTFRLQKNADVVFFFMDDPASRVSYAAFLRDRTVSASSRQGTVVEGHACLGDGETAPSTDYAFTLKGTFSDDFKRFTATEVWTFSPWLGGTIKRTFSWNAELQ
jgi:hypothetical protein